MPSDARLNTGLAGHHKTKKLLRRLGPAGPWGLVCLFLWAAANRSDGDLSGMSVEDIELAADWTGEPDALVTALSEVGFLDGDPGDFRIHDWAEHNPWAAGAEDRAEASRWAALCKRYGRPGAAERMPDYAARMRVAREPDAPLPSPSPIPSPIPEKEKEQKPPRSRGVSKTPLPADFSISERVAKWAESKGYGRLTDHLEAFKITAQARGYTYADWDAALMNAIRDDWAKLRVNGSPIPAGGGRREL